MKGSRPDRKANKRRASTGRREGKMDGRENGEDEGSSGDDGSGDADGPTPIAIGQSTGERTDQQVATDQRRPNPGDHAFRLI